MHTRPGGCTAVCSKVRSRCAAVPLISTWLLREAPHMQLHDPAARQRDNGIKKLDLGFLFPFVVKELQIQREREKYYVRTKLTLGRDLSETTHHAYARVHPSPGSSSSQQSTRNHAHVRTWLRTPASHTVPVPPNGAAIPNKKPAFPATHAQPSPALPQHLATAHCIIYSI